MAVTIDRVPGEHEVVYVSDTEPADATDPANYEPLGLRTELTFSSQAPETEIADVHGTTKSYGTNAGTYTMGWNIAPSVDAGQEVVRTGHETTPKPLRWFLITSGDVGDRLIHFKGQVGQYNEAGSYNNPLAASATIGLDGSRTVSTVPEP